MNEIYTKPKVVRWKVVAGPSLSPAQTYDVILEENDYKIRQLKIPPKVRPQNASRIQLEGS